MIFEKLDVRLHFGFLFDDALEADGFIEAVIARGRGFRVKGWFLQFLALGMHFAKEFKDHVIEHTEEQVHKECYEYNQCMFLVKSGFINEWEYSR